MCQIAILLATYNSALYLSELLDSLLSQTYNNWRLYVIDDGSVDNTMEILSNYESKSDKISLVENLHKHNGPKNNFMYLLSITDSDYYMFCDHDDIWLPNKIEKSIECMADLEKNNFELPVIIHSDLCVVDAQLNLIDYSFFKYASISPQILLSSIYHLSHSNCVTGCTMLFNSAVKSLVFPMSKYALMHDSWVALKVLAEHGMIHCIEEPLILYRQHGNNTLGAVKRHFSRNLFKTIKSNLRQYQMAHEITKIGLLNFIYYRLMYLYKRA